MMQVKTYTQFNQFNRGPYAVSFSRFVQKHSNGNFFQSEDCFELVEKIEGYHPFLLIACDEEESTIYGSLLGVFQSNGSHLKSWFSRRLIIWGGPLVAENGMSSELEVIRALVEEMKKHAGGRAIYIEFRNFFDTSYWRGLLESYGFEYRPHLNYLVKTDTFAAVKKRMSKSRMRQIKSSRKAGASISEPENEGEVMQFYEILKTLYREKVKKPLPGPELFVQMWKSPQCRIFLVKYEGAVVGGIACPVFNSRVIYEWYVCGKDGAVKGLYPSVLATWAPIEYGMQNGLNHFDFMGAGRPDQDYGVREFKARFGGEEVCYGRYHLILSKPLYEVGKFGLKVYQKFSS